MIPLIKHSDGSTFYVAADQIVRIEADKATGKTRVTLRDGKDYGAKRSPREVAERVGLDMAETTA